MRLRWAGESRRAQGPSDRSPRKSGHALGNLFFKRREGAQAFKDGASRDLRTGGRRCQQGGASFDLARREGTLRPWSTRRRSRLIPPQVYEFPVRSAEIWTPKAIPPGMPFTDGSLRRAGHFARSAGILRGMRASLGVIG